MDELQRVVWEGAFPLHIELSEDELLLHHDCPRPFFTMAYRCSYLPLLLPTIRRHYINFVKEIDGDGNAGGSGWFSDCKGQPIPWHLPIGLLFDMKTRAIDNTSQQGLPWTLKVHFKAFPHDKLIPMTSSTSTPTLDPNPFQTIFFSMLKEADYLRNGSCKIIMNLPKADQNQLWDALLTHQYERFWKVNHKLVQTARHIPLRLYLEDGNVIQNLVKSTGQNGTNSTLSEIVTQFELGKSCRLTIHGIELPLNTPLDWLARHLCYADNFLHIIVL